MAPPSEYLPETIIDLVAPAGYKKPEDILPAVERLVGMGFSVRVARGMLKENEYSHLAQTQKFRTEDMIAALKSDSSAILIMRGGEGTNDIITSVLANIDDSTPRKPICGLSDPTLFINALADKGFPVIHGPVASTLPEEGSQALAEFKKAMQGYEVSHSFNNLTPLNEAAFNQVTPPIKAPGGGGNIALLRSGIGTPYAANLSGKFILLEDVGETPERLEQMLTQLNKAGSFNGVKAVIFGSFESEQKKLNQEDREALHGILKNFAATLQKYGIPVFSDAKGFGHMKNPDCIGFSKMTLELANNAGSLTAYSPGYGADTETNLPTKGRILLRGEEQEITLAQLPEIILEKKTPPVDDVSPRHYIASRIPRYSITVSDLVRKFGNQQAQEELLKRLKGKALVVTVPEEDDGYYSKNPWRVLRVVRQAVDTPELQQVMQGVYISCEGHSSPDIEHSSRRNEILMQQRLQSLTLMQPPIKKRERGL